MALVSPTPAAASPDPPADRMPPRPAKKPRGNPTLHLAPHAACPRA